MDRFIDGSWLDGIGMGHHKSTQDAVAQFWGDNKFNVGIFCFLIILIIRQYRSNSAKVKAAGANREYMEAEGFPEIERLEKFKWQDEEPIKFRTFRPKYYLTMDFSDASAIQNLIPSELLTMDRTYADRIQYRKRIIKESGDICMGVHDESRIRPAIVELYSYLLGHYLPKRYPSMFKLHYAQFETGDQFMFENLVTKQIFPVNPAAVTNTQTLLSTLGQTVDEDFLFLLPEGDFEDAKYKLEAYVCICPSGWNPPDKLGKRLATIHGPVPGYKDKLEGSMDRYFKSLEVGKYVKRSNWSITLHEDLFLPDPHTNHATPEQEEPAVEKIDPDKTFLRCERQTLHRLPRSKAIVFAFKTYMETLRDIKLEGLGDELAEAIDGLKNGNVPAMNVYKRGSFWGEAVKDYLRS